MSPLIINLPCAKVVRWTPKQKAAVCAAVLAGELPFIAALDRYRLSPEELNSWLSAYRTGGQLGLRIYGATP